MPTLKPPAARPPYLDPVTFEAAVERLREVLSVSRAAYVSRRAATDPHAMSRVMPPGPRRDLQADRERVGYAAEYDACVRQARRFGML